MHELGKCFVVEEILKSVFQEGLFRKGDKDFTKVLLEINRANDTPTRLSKIGFPRQSQSRHRETFFIETTLKLSSVGTYRN